MKENKVGLFVENFIVYGLGGIISKIIPLIMLPIVLRIIPSSDYFGISDMSNTLVHFGTSVAIMGMYDAMYRMYFEKEDEKYKRIVCSTAFAFTLCTSAIVFCVMLLFRRKIASLFFGSQSLAYVVYLSAVATLVGATNGIISAPTRMQNKKFVFLITNFLGSLISYSIAIPLLIAKHYVIALPLAAIVSGITLEISFWILNRKWFSISLFDKKLLIQMLGIAIPLFPNFLVYWLFNSCDKVMITNMLGIGDAGIYSVASKLGNVSQLIYTAFAGGWQFFAFSTMKEKNQVKSNSMVFEYLGALAFAATTFICAWSKGIFHVLSKPEYLEGYLVAPYLFLAPLLQMLFQVAVNQFLVVKKTWPNTVILLIGAVANIILNYFLIPLIGIEGAAIATLIGYFLSNVVCICVLRKMELMDIGKRFIRVSILFSSYFLAWRVWFADAVFLGTVIACVFLGYMFIEYKKEILILVNMILKRKPKKD